MITESSNYVWRTWTCDSTNSYHSGTESYSCHYPTSTVTDVVWHNWATDGASYTYGGTVDATWTQWVTVYYTTDNIETVIANQPVVSEEEARIRREREALEAEARRLREIERQKSLELEEKKKEEAEQFAKTLLLDLIGEDELKIYEETGRVFIEGREFDYIIQRSGYLQKITKTKVVDLCVHLQNKTKYPETDNVIALLLGIQHDENRILKLANTHGSRNIPQELPKCAKVA